MLRKSVVHRFILLIVAGQQDVVSIPENMLEGRLVIHRYCTDGSIVRHVWHAAEEDQVSVEVVWLHGVAVHTECKISIKRPIDDYIMSVPSSATRSTGSRCSTDASCFILSIFIFLM